MHNKWEITFRDGGRVLQVSACDYRLLHGGAVLSFHDDSAAEVLAIPIGNVHYWRPVDDGKPGAADVRTVVSVAPPAASNTSYGRGGDGPSRSTGAPIGDSVAGELGRRVAG